MSKYDHRLFKPDLSATTRVRADELRKGDSVWSPLIERSFHVDLVAKRDGEDLIIVFTLPGRFDPDEEFDRL